MKNCAGASRPRDPVYFSGEPQRYRRKTAADRGRRRRIHHQAIFHEGFGAAREESDRPAAAGKIAKARGAPRRDSRPAGRNEHSGPDAVARDGAEILPVDDSPRTKKSAICSLRPGSAPTRGWARWKAKRPCFRRCAGRTANSKLISMARPRATTISRTTTGLLMEALRLVDEGQRDGESEDAQVTEG